ncbi:MAG: hypothetical protein GF313_04060 [Caldithrix sp.]|nr:hypothetical protein [Caldithrix sp.]
MDFKKTMMKIMMRMTPTCEVISEKVSQSMDRKLSPKEWIQVKIHLMQCHLCNRYREQLLAMQKVLRQYGAMVEENSGLADLRMDEQAKERIKDRLHKVSGPRNQ